MTNTEPLDASVTLEEIFAVVGQKRVPLAPELAGYLVLELAESAGGEIDARYVYVSEEGTVAYVRGPNEAVGDAEASLRALLGRLLETAAAQTPALASVVRRKGGAGVLVLVEELEAALIPVNRSAGKRALARLARETKRVTLRVGRNASAPQIDLPQVRSEKPPPAAISFDQEEVPTTARRDVPSEVMDSASRSLEPPMPQMQSASNLPTTAISKEDLEAAAVRAKRDSVDSLLDSFEVSGKREDSALSKELKQMAGLSPTPPPQNATLRSDDPPNSDSIESLLAASAPMKSDPNELRKSTGKESPASRRPSSYPPQPQRDVPAMRERAPSFANERQLPTLPSQVKKMQHSVTSELLRKQRRGPGIGVLVLLAAILVGLAVAVWFAKPGFLTGRTPEQIASERAAAASESARIAAVRSIPPCHATLVVDGAPKDSEILVREGQAPVDIQHMPIGARLEFVATAEGFGPKRAIVPGGANWDKARFDLPIQLDKSKARPGTVDLWPAGEPGSEVGGKGAPGVVHVISSPKGAEIWLLAGLGPDSTIEDIVACDTDVDLLIAGPTTYRKRLHVGAASFVADAAKPGLRTARISAK